MQMPLQYVTAVALCGFEKMRPAPGEEPAARKPGLGRGGWDGTGLADLSSIGRAQREAAVAAAGRGSPSASQTLGSL